jgi:hypothetical protein
VHKFFQEKYFYGDFENRIAHLWIERNVAPKAGAAHETVAARFVRVALLLKPLCRPLAAVKRFIKTSIPMKGPTLSRQNHSLTNH